MNGYTAAEILKFASYTRLGATIALRYQAGLEISEAVDVIEIACAVHPLVGEILIDGYMQRRFGATDYTAVMAAQAAYA